MKKERKKRKGERGRGRVEERGRETKSATKA